MGVEEGGSAEGDIKSKRLKRIFKTNGTSGHSNVKFPHTYFNLNQFSNALKLL